MGIKSIAVMIKKIYFAFPLLFLLLIACNPEEDMELQSPTMEVSMKNCDDTRICGDITFTNIYREGWYIDGSNNTVVFTFIGTDDNQTEYTGEVNFRGDHISYELTPAEISSNGDIDFDLSLLQQYGVNIQVTVRNLSNEEYQIPEEDIILTQ